MLRSSRLNFLYSSLFIFFFIVVVYGCSRKNEVVYFWAGALQPTSIRVTAKLLEIPKRVRLVVSTKPDFSSSISGPFGNVDPGNKDLVSLFISGLQPGEKYYYAIEPDGKLDTSYDDVGSFMTPGDSAFSFRFTLASCLHSNSHHPVLKRIAEKDPLFFLQMGDFHYDNPNSSSSLNVHQLPYERLLANDVYQSFFRKIPFAYMWDDHDYAGNNSDSTASGKANARIAYREYIPHYAFGTVSPENNAPIYQSFTIGRVRYILKNLR